MSSRVGVRFLRARVAARHRATPAGLRRRLARSLGLAVVAAVLALPLAAAWGIGHARVSDYLGPHRAVFTADYSGQVELDLGPLGNAYVPSPVAPLGLSIDVGGVGGETATGNAFFSEQTLAEYTSLYADPGEVVAGITERVAQQAIEQTFAAELLVLVAVAGWLLRRRLLAPSLLRQVSRRRVIGVWAGVSALVLGSILAPAPAPDSPRLPVSVEYGGRDHQVLVDNVVLADVLSRGIKGVELLSERQQDTLDAYVRTATAGLAASLSRLPAPAPGETMLLGYADLHCNQAMTELIGRLVAVAHPAVVLSAGDDTVNGTAAERGCVRREAGMAGGVPLIVATGNHDSDLTEAQMRAAGMAVLNGAPVTIHAGREMQVVGDDDPERNPPFSLDRTMDRAETEQQLGERMARVAGPKGVEAIVVHQPDAAAAVLARSNPPARLVLWGHMHTQLGPTVIRHDDGTWTVAMQQGTAGGVRQPTLTSFSTPFSPPLVSADVYFYFSDDSTGLITGVQPVHFTPGGKVVISSRISTGRADLLPEQTREKLGAPSTTPTPDSGR